MKNLILLNILLSTSVSSQYHQDFIYEKIVTIDGSIGKVEKYDSKSGIYYKESCHRYAPPFKKEIELLLTDNEKLDLSILIKKFGNLGFVDCNTNKNITVKSYFYYKHEKFPLKCLGTDVEKRQFIKLDMTLSQVLQSKPEYRKTYYWEFIKK